MGFKLTQKPWRIAAAVAGCVLAPAIALTAWASSYQSLVCSAIGGTTFKTIKSEESENIDTEYFKTNGKSLADWVETEDALIRKVQAEGTVLLKNKDKTLPLKSGAKVSAFGYGTIKTVSTGLVRFGAPATYIDFKTGMEEDGKLQLNPTLYDFYKNNATADLKLSKFNEVDVGGITDEVRSSYASYNDAAIVVISRSGGEGSDLINTGIDKYLELQPQERAMLEEVTAHFDKVIAIVNTSHAMELGWVDEFDIDACLMVGAVGYNGLNAVSDIIVGRSNPCGHTVDTYAADSYSAPAMMNFGDYTYSNGAAIVEQIGAGANATKYVVEKEGIYVGYKYYETRYEDSVLGRGNATSAKGASTGEAWNYDAEVVYPFGYGLSYSTFKQELLGVDEKDDAYEVRVKVTNGGDYKGRSVVQVYAQTPYTDFDKQNKIEAAAVQLAGFGKTKELDVGGTDEVVVTVKKEDLAHYDPYVNNTYIMEAGSYYISVGDNAHDALNNILKAKGANVDGNANKVHSFDMGRTDTDTYSATDGNVKITNLFDDADLNYWIKDSVTYLSRSDWDATYPTTETSLTATAAMIKALNAEGEYEAGSSDLSSIKTGSGTAYNAAMMIGVDFEDMSWSAILDQMTVEDYLNLCGRSGLAVVENISYPATFMKDGSHRVADRPYLENGEFAHVFPSAVIMAASYDRELMYEIGSAFGEDNLRTGTVGHYAPSVNIHRTPYAGRNFEYFSEDGYLSGEMSVGSIKGMQEKGAIPYLKHFALNDQETNRQGVSTFVNQQAVREIYLEAFKAGVVEGKTKGLMGGFNRVGCTWTGAHKGLQTYLLRDEWDSTAISDTDAVFGYNSAMGIKSGLEAGTTMWATSGTAIYDAVIDDAKKDAKMVANMRESCHYMLYNIVNSMAFNGIAPSDKIVEVMPWWQSLLIAIDCIIGVVLAGSIAMVAVAKLKGKKEEE